MIYKIHSVIDEKTIYARIDDDGLCRVTCTEQNPEYLAWLNEGNVPEPAEES